MMVNIKNNCIEIMTLNKLQGISTMLIVFVCIKVILPTESYLSLNFLWFMLLMQFWGFTLFPYLTCRGHASCLAKVHISCY